MSFSIPTSMNFFIKLIGHYFGNIQTQGINEDKQDF